MPLYLFESLRVNVCVRMYVACVCLQVCTTYMHAFIRIVLKEIQIIIPPPLPIIVMTREKEICKQISIN